MDETLKKHLNTQKLYFAKSLLGMCPFVLIDALQEEVKVPESLRQEDLVLRLGQHKDIMNIPDLQLLDEGWSGTISINPSRHFIYVPWSAVTRVWVGPPFAGPIVIWDDFKNAKGEEEPKKPALTLVKS